MFDEPPTTIPLDSYFGILKSIETPFRWLVRSIPVMDFAFLSSAHPEWCVSNVEPHNLHPMEAKMISCGFACVEIVGRVEHPHRVQVETAFRRLYDATCLMEEVDRVPQKSRLAMAELVCLIRISPEAVAVARYYEGNNQLLASNLWEDVSYDSTSKPPLPPDEKRLRKELAESRFDIGFSLRNALSKWGVRAPGAPRLTTKPDRSGD